MRSDSTATPQEAPRRLPHSRSQPPRVGFNQLKDRGAPLGQLRATPKVGCLVGLVGAVRRVSRTCGG